MILRRFAVFICCFFISSSLLAETTLTADSTNKRFIHHIVDPSQQRLELVWRDDQKQPFGYFQNVRQEFAEQDKQIRFAMNAGIFQQDLTPLGLYIEHGEMLRPLNRRQQGYGNFYLQPNGVFVLHRDGKADIVSTTDFKMTPNIDYATQSGPLLLIDGEINPLFKPESMSLRIRNGVGLLADGRLVFVLSRGFVSFYDFAAYFQSLDSQQALYLDGSISRVYLPEQGIEQDGHFGPMIIELAE